MMQEITSAVSVTRNDRRLISISSESRLTTSQKAAESPCKMSFIGLACSFARAAYCLRKTRKEQALSAKALSLNPEC